MKTGDAGAQKIAWILGAGFSRGLGGPLIKNLLAPREEKVLRNLFPMPAHAIPIADILKAQAFYAWGKERGNWDDAEQFLDLVESAAAEPPPALSHANQLLTAMLTGTVPAPDPNPPSNAVSYTRVPTYYDFATLANLAQAARRALAVDCSLFLRSAQLDSERWAPYKHWAESLDSNHTVITFNYDQVPELLANLPASSLRVVPPTDSNTAFQRLKDSRKVPVLKVHGSVTWRSSDKGIVVTDVMDPSIGDPSVAPMIGVPGPGKRRLVAKTLNELWELALEMVRQAAKIYFVGYRFPPTDADSRSGLLGALHGRGSSIRTVLGPWVSDADSLRLRHLLQAASNGSVGAIPLLAEDFIGLWEMVAA